MHLCIGPSLPEEEVMAENCDLRDTISDVCWQEDYKLYFWTWTMRFRFILLFKIACATATALTDKHRYVMGASIKPHVKPLAFSQRWRQEAFLLSFHKAPKAELYAAPLKSRPHLSKSCLC